MELESKQKKQLLTALGVYAIVFLVLLLISNLTSVAVQPFASFPSTFDWTCHCLSLQSLFSLF